MMFALQSSELGYRVDLEDFVDLIGFLADSWAQDGFPTREIPKFMRKWVVDEPYWEGSDVDRRDRLQERISELEDEDETEDGW